MYFHLVALLLCAAWCENANAFETGRRKLLLVSLDGYRVDYFDRKLMPEFERFRSEGAAVQFVLPTYPSVTFTCHYTIVTGRHADHHGIVANSFFDPSINATFSKSQNTQVWWNYNSTVPIWITAKEKGLKVVTYFYPGSEVEFEIDGKKIRPDFWAPYNESVPLVTRIDTVVHWLVNESADFAVLYHWQPDSTGHMFGPDSPQMNKTLKKLDGDLAYLFQRINETGLSDELNVIVVSDHGMQSIQKTLFLDKDFGISSTDYRAYQNGPMLSLDVTNTGNKTEIFSKLNNSSDLTVFYKDEIPGRFHYGRNPRVAEIVVMAKPGICVRPPGRACDGGNHGYDNQVATMRASFVARGPDFRSGFVAEPIRQTDIYPLLTHLLRVKGQSHDGNFESIKSVLKASASRHFAAAFLLVLALFASLFAC